MILGVHMFLARLNKYFRSLTGNKDKLCMATSAQDLRKRSRARVTIGGQYVLLQNSLKNKLFDFLKPKLPYKSHLSRHTSEPLKKNGKKIRN